MGAVRSQPSHLGSSNKKEAVQEEAAGPRQRDGTMRSPGGTDRRQRGERQDAVVELYRSRVLKRIPPARQSPVLAWEPLSVHGRKRVVRPSGVQPCHKCTCTRPRTD